MPKLTKLKYKTYEEFIGLRNSLDGFGGSDIGTIMGLNPYKSKLEFFHEKVGLHNPIKKDSPAMYRGRVLEDVVIDHYWQYHDPENPVMDALLMNAQDKIVQRDCKKINYILINSDYPWLFSSIDYGILEIVGKKKTIVGALEVKTDTGYGSFKWEGDINPSHIVQHQQQLLVSGLSWGEIAILTDATWFKCIRFEANEDIQYGIIQQTKDFYHRVKAAQAILLSSVGSEEEKLAQVQELEPEVEGTEAYEKYLKSHYRSTNNTTLLGKDKSYEWASSYKEADVKMQMQEEVKQLNKNKLLRYMAINKANAIDFGQGGKVFIQRDGKLKVKIN